MPAAVPVLLQLAEVAAQLGHRERGATALYNAAIALASVEQYEDARALADEAGELYGAGSDDASKARKLADYCRENSKLS